MPICYLQTVPKLSHAQLYRQIHTGNPGDVDFYKRVVSGGTKVLELGCGWGRVLRPVAKEVAEALGIEWDPDLCAQAHALLEELPGATAVAGDIRELGKLGLGEERFDRVLIPYNTLYALGGPDGVRRCLKGASRLLKEGGELWADVYSMDAYQQAALAETLPEHEDDGEPIALLEVDGNSLRVFEESTIDHVEQRLDVLYRVVDEGGREVLRSPLRHDYLLLEELSDLLAECSLELAMVAGGFEGQPYDDEADQLIVGATKKIVP